MKPDEGLHPPGNPGLHLIGTSYEPPTADQAALDARFVWKAAHAIALERKTLDVKDAEDVASHVRDTWVNRTESDPEFLRDRDKVMGFIAACVRNRLIDIWSHRRVRRQAEPKLILETEDNLSAADPVAELEIQERKEAVNDALERLPTKRRRICAMFYLDGAERQEIADALGIALRTVDKHVQLGNADLQRLLRKYAPRSARKEEA